MQTVTSILNHDRFDFIFASCLKKYKLVNKEIPFVDNKYAKFAHGDCIIEIFSFHLKPDMKVNYMTNKFSVIYDNKFKQKKDQKKKHQ